MPYAASFIDWVHWAALFVLTAALLAAALTDAATYLIPNRYSAAIIVAFAAFAIGQPVLFALKGLGAGLLLLALGALLFERRMLGGGDVKLLAAAGLWAGFDLMALLIFTSAVAGGLLALAQLSPLGRLMPARPGGGPVGTDFRSRLRQPMPFGVAVALGGVCIAISRLHLLTSGA
ncbi:MAG TPA: prepilin peptidase [Stellaceae bacterium]